MSEEKRRGQPANAFEKYPTLNEAYLQARDNVNRIVISWNSKNPGNEVIQVDVPLMLFIHSCIPPELGPQPFENHSRNIRPRMQNIVYPLVSSKALDQDAFAERIMDYESAKNFLNSWLANKRPRRATPPKQPRPTLKDYLRDKFVGPDSQIILRYLGKVYKGRITGSGQIEMDIGKGLQIFKSPNAVLDKGFNATGPTASELMHIVDDSGRQECLQDIKRRYIAWKGL